MTCKRCGDSRVSNAGRCLGCGRRVVLCDGGKQPDDDTPAELGPEDIVDDTEGGASGAQSGVSPGSDSGARGEGSQRSEHPAPQPETGQQRRDQQSDDIATQLENLPLKRGGALGALLTFMPYVLATVVVSLIHEQDITLDGDDSGPLDIGAEVSLSILSLGSPERVLDSVLSTADVDIGNVDPSDYPTFEDELATLVDLLLISPQSVLLLAYLIVPYLFFKTGGWLTAQAPSQSAAGYLKAGLVPVVGTLPVAAVLALAFNVVSTNDKILFAGVLVPAAFSGFGAATAWVYRNRSLRSSRALGLGAVAGGLVAAMVVLPMGTELSLSSSDRLLLGLLGYVEVLQATGLGETEPLLVFLIAVGLLVGAGFYRANSSTESVLDRNDAIRVGASIAYGTVWTVAVLFWLIPVVFVVVDLAAVGPSIEVFGLDPADPQEVGVYSSITDYRSGILIGGLVVPALAGAVGGYIAAWRSGSQQTDRPDPRRAVGQESQQQPARQQTDRRGDRQDRATQHEQEPQRPPEGDEPEPAQQSQEEGIDRRVLLGGAALAAAGGGWFFLTGSDGPEDIVREYIGALEDGDVERQEELVHEEASGFVPTEEGAEITSREVEQVDLEEFAREVGTSEAEIEAEMESVIEEVGASEYAFVSARIESEEFGEEEEYFALIDDGGWKLYAGG